MNIPENLKYTKDHEWVKVEDKTVTIGVTDFAQQQLGDIVFVELPEADDELENEDSFAVLESVKAAADVYAPVAGTVVEVNEELEDDPALVNSDPYGQGWLIKVELSGDEDFSSFMNVEQYKQFVEEQE